MSPHYENQSVLPSQEKKHLGFFPKESNRVYNNKQSLYEYLLEKNKEHFNDVAITFGNMKISYEELHDRIDVYARALYRRGVRKGDIVGLCLANTPEGIFLFYAINKLGAVTCQINPMDNAFKIMKDLEVVKPKMIITINDSYGSIKKAQKSLNVNIDTIVYPAVQSVDNGLIKFLYGTKQVISGNALWNMNNSLKKIISQSKKIDGVVFPKYEPDTLSNIVFTGGSSGTHKGVDLSSNGLNDLMDAYGYFNLLEPGEIFMGHLPLFMGFGILALHYALCTNTNLFLTFKALPQDFISELDRIHPAAAFGGPIHWETFITNPAAKKLDLSNLKEPVSGGEQLVVEKWVKINEILKSCNAPTTLWNGLGMSEMWSASALNRGSAVNTVGTVGVAYPCNNVKIVDMESEVELGYNQVGRYYITGPSMMLCYHNNPEETARVIKRDENGVKWLSTGDLAKIDTNGEITFLGRTKRCFVSGVTNIYPEQIEDLLGNIPEIIQSIVTHVKCEGNQNVPIYHVRINNMNIDQKALTKKINSYIQSTLGESAVAYDIVYTDQALPVTKNGKLDPKPLQAKDDSKYAKLKAK